jgi:hypothetical protein
MRQKLLGKKIHKFHFTLGKRLSLSVGFVACVLVGVSLYTIESMNRLAMLTNELYQHPFTVNTAVLRVESGIVSMHRSMKDVALANNLAEIEAAAEKVADVEAAVFDDFDIIMAQFLGDKTTIEKARQKFADWKRIRDRVIKLRKEGKVAEAAAITKGKGPNISKVYWRISLRWKILRRIKPLNFYRMPNKLVRKSFGLRALRSPMRSP